MRTRRYGSASASSVTAEMPSAPTTARWVLRTPPATSTEMTTSASTIAEPRSGSFITSRVTPPSTQSTGPDHAPPVVQLTGATAHEIGGVEEQRELGELAGLEPEDARTQPPPGARHVDADARDQHDDEQHRAHDQQGPHQRAPPAVVEADGEHERTQAECRPHQLAEEEVPRRPVVGERRDRRRREHHHHTDDVEHRDRRHEQDRGRRAGGGRVRGTRRVPRMAVRSDRARERGHAGSPFGHGAGSPFRPAAGVSSLTSRAKSSPRSA